MRSGALFCGLQIAPQSRVAENDMHEAAIAASIIEIAEDAARERGHAQITAIGLRLGAFTGIVREALEFAFEALRDGTLASNARLAVQEVPLLCACAGCGWSGPPEEDFCLVCPRCQSPADILRGREMHVEYVDLDLESREGETIHGTSRSGDQGAPQERRMR